MLAQGIEDLEAVGILDVFGWTQYREDINKTRVTTTYPHSRNHDNIGRLKKNGAKAVKGSVAMDNRIISCSSSLDVAFLLMEYLMGPEMTEQVRHYMIYRGNP